MLNSNYHTDITIIRCELNESGNLRRHTAQVFCPLYKNVVLSGNTSILWKDPGLLKRKGFPWPPNVAVSVIRISNL